MVVSKKTFSVILMAVFGILTLSSGSALAVSSYLNSFNSQYGASGTALDSCNLCHTSVPSLNGYGDDYSNGHNFPNIEGLDSDVDGFVNIDEINALTFPGDASSFPDVLPTCTDSDADGFAVEGGDCGAVDCDDSNPAINPGAQESCTDGIDNNCNGLIDTQDPQAVNCPPVCTDVDGDGYAIEGGDCGQIDCDDTNPNVNPGSAENCTDGIDNDCDSLVDAADPDAVNCPVEPPPAPTCTDNDLDGFALEGGDCGLVDCNDSDPAINPDAVESCTDGLDNNCDGLVDAADPNAVGCPAGCTDLDLDGYAIEGGDCGPIDCNDQDEFINPSAAEECTDGIDNDCDDLIDVADPNAVNCPVECTDVDGDGYAIDGDACGQIDCSDSDPSINPGATEICGDGIDQNCDGSDLSCDAVLSPPSLSLSVSGVNLSVSWTTVEGATGYTLSYAPYPYEGTESIVSVDMGNTTSTSYTLWEDAAYYVAVQAYNDEGSSGYSNIEYFIIESDDDDDGDDGDDEADDEADDDSVNINPADGTLLYANNCASCHGSLERSDVGGEDADDIEEAIEENEGGMGFLSSLDQAQIRSIAEALSSVDNEAADEADEADEADDEADDDSANIAPADGALLYANNCASCHGSLERSDVGGEDADDIEEAIEENEGGMGFLSSLDQAQIRAIAEALDSIDND